VAERTPVSCVFPPKRGWEKVAPHYAAEPIFSPYKTGAGSRHYPRHRLLAEMHHDISTNDNNLSIAFLLISSNLRNTTRQVMVAEDHTSPGGVPDKHAPFYGNKIGRCIFCELHRNR